MEDVASMQVQDLCILRQPRGEAVLQAACPFGMENVVIRRASMRGARPLHRQPRGQFCRQHALDGTEYVVTRRCKHARPGGGSSSSTSVA